MKTSEVRSSDNVFVRLISAGTAIGFAGMMASLACLRRGTNGRVEVAINWWGAAVLGAIGFAAGIGFWRLLWKAEAEQNPARPLRRRLVWYSIGLGILAFTCFLYPIRFVDPVRRQDVLLGLIMAIAVLAFVGWLIYQVIRWVSSNEPEDGESE